jgi:hypothetical protein
VLFIKASSKKRIIKILINLIITAFLIVKVPYRINHMKKTLFVCAAIFLAASVNAQTKTSRQSSGNPLFPGWYADPEGAVFDKQYWIYPTFSAPYNKQVFLDAFSSPDALCDIFG